MSVLNYNSEKTKAFVLCTIPINDHTQFVHFYTQHRGRITCRVPLASRGRKASQLRMMMAPMTLLDLVLKPGHGEILQIADAEIVRSPYMLTMTHPGKATQCIFIAELTHHVVRPLEQVPDPQFWQFLLQSLETLENTESGWTNFHLIFTSQLISHVGFCIDADEYLPDYLFDLKEGVFTPGPIYHPYYLTAESAKWLQRVLLTNYANMHELPFSREQRNIMLDILLAFLHQQIPEIGELKSLDILKAISE